MKNFSLRLDNELLHDIGVAAAQAGQSKQEWMEKALRDRLEQPSEPEPKAKRGRKSVAITVPRKVVLAGKPCRHDILNCRVCKTGRWSS